MQKTGKAALIPLAVTALLIAATGIASLSSPGKREPREKPAHIRAVLELAAMADTSKALIIGYQYDLVQRFAADNGQTVSIELTGGTAVTWTRCAPAPWTSWSSPGSKTWLRTASASPFP